MKDLFILYAGKCYGDTFYYAIRERVNYLGVKYYDFGKVYHDGLISHYDFHGFCSYKTKTDALKACIKFSGKNCHLVKLKSYLTAKV